MKRTMVVLTLLILGALAVERHIEAVTHARHIARTTGAGYWQVLNRPVIDMLGLRSTTTTDEDDNQEGI